MDLNNSIYYVGKGTTRRGRKKKVETNIVLPVLDMKILLCEETAEKLDKLVKKFEFDLYHLSSQIGGVPEEFIKSHQEFSSAGKLKKLNVKKDGVEIVPVTLSGDKRKQCDSWSDISDYESDDEQQSKKSKTAITE